MLFQHVPLLAHSAGSPFFYTNADEIYSALPDGKHFALSAHFHRGIRSSVSGTEVISVPALCRYPFAMSLIEIAEDGSFTVENIPLAPDKLSRPADLHTHTHFAYCNDNMDFERTMELKELFRLEQLAFTEHSAHLYMTPPEYSDFASNGIFHTGGKERLTHYLEESEKFRSTCVLRGFEVDCDFSGNPVLFSEHRDDADILLGALHFIPAEYAENEEKAEEFFRWVMPRFLKSPMDILAHPFRIFRRCGLRTPESLFPFLADLLKTHGIAAEINFHTNEPPPEFIEMCLDRGVKISFGSDSHHLYEIGDFYPHIRLLESIGCSVGEMEKHLFR